MEKYEPLEIVIIEFDGEDVITNSDVHSETMPVN